MFTPPNQTQQLNHVFLSQIDFCFISSATFSESNQIHDSLPPQKLE